MLKIEQAVEPIELIVDKELMLRQVTFDDVDVFFSLVDRNREYLDQYGEKIATNLPTRMHVLNLLKSINAKDLLFGIWADDEYAGNIVLDFNETITAARIGYYLGEEFTGSGYMTRSVESVVCFSFKDFSLDFIEAIVRQDNIQSASVLLRNGFKKCAEKKDHDIYLLFNPDAIDRYSI